MMGAGWTLIVGQPVMRTVAAGHHRRRGERHRVGQVGFDLPVPGGHPARAATRHRLGDGVVDGDARPRRSIATVIAICGADGTDVPVCTTVSPSVNAAPHSSRPETNCEEAEASMCTVPPRTDPRPRTVNGRPVAVDVDAEFAQPIEQWRDRPGAGLLVTVEDAPPAVPSAASGGTNRSTVPARPQSMRASAGRDSALR